MRWQIENRGKRRSGKVEFMNPIDQQRRQMTTHQCLKKNGKGRRVFACIFSSKAKPFIQGGGVAAMDHFWGRQGWPFAGSDGESAS